MKKILCIFIALTLLCCLPVNAAEQNDHLFDLVSLDIIKGDGNGNYRLEDTMTRAEFSTCITRLMGYEDVAESLPFIPRFEDVDASSSMAPYINFLVDLNVVNGVSETHFAPNQEILYPQAVKILVNILGYGIVAQERGGYPDGYLSVSASIGLLKGVVPSDPLTRGNVVELIYNALDIEILEEQSDATVVKSGRTFRQVLFSQKDSFQGTGIVTADVYTWLEAPNSDFKEDQVEIDGVIYQKGAIKVSHLLGQEVEYFAWKDEHGKYHLTSIHATEKNTIFEIESKDLVSISSEKVFYENETGDEKSVALAPGCKVVKNGRMLDTFTFDQLLPQKGGLKLIDNTGDRKADILLIEDYENIRVESTNKNTIVLSGTDRLSGKKYFTVDLDQDAFRTVIYSADGEEISISDIAPGAIISAFVSEDQMLYKLIVSTKKEEAVITEISGDEITAGEKIYDKHGDDSFDIPFGQNVLLLLDYRGYIADIEQEQEVKQYAYVIRSREKGGFSETLSLQMIIGSKIEMKQEKNEANENDTNLIPVLLCQNQDVLVLETAQKFKLDGNIYHGSSVPTGIYQYTLNEEGQVVSLDSLVFAGGGTNMKYNVYDKTFGANLANEPIAINENTVVICLPKNADAKGDDYLVPLEISNRATVSSFDVWGYDYDADTKKVKVVVFEAVMYSASIPAIDPDAGSPLIGMVQRVSRKIDEDGEVCIKLNLVSGGSEQEYTIRDIDAHNSFFTNLNSGDLIYYAKNLSGEIANYKLIHSFHRGMSKTPYHKNRGNVNEKIFGYVTDMSYDDIDGSRNILVDRLTMVSDDIMDIDVRVRNAPPVFIYDSANGNVTMGVVRDILPTGGDTEAVFLLRPYSSVVRACVIVR